MSADIDRLGFEAWADNIIVNVLEDLKGGRRPQVDGADGTVNVSWHGDERELHFVVRAYVAERGWLSHWRSVRK